MSQQFVDVPGKTIRWAGNRISPPPDVPECGFDGSKCTDGKYNFAVVVGFTEILGMNLKTIFH